MRIIGAIIDRTHAAGNIELPAREMGPFETIYIDEMVAACNGGGGPLGHPKVYLNLAPAGRAECPYCSRLFISRAIAVATAEPGPQAATEKSQPGNGQKSATFG